MLKNIPRTSKFSPTRLASTSSQKALGFSPIYDLRPNHPQPEQPGKPREKSLKRSERSKHGNQLRAFSQSGSRPTHGTGCWFLWGLQRQKHTLTQTATQTCADIPKSSQFHPTITEKQRWRHLNLNYDHDLTLTTPRVQQDNKHDAGRKKCKGYKNIFICIYCISTSKACHKYIHTSNIMDQNILIEKTCLLNNNIISKKYRKVS